MDERIELFLAEVEIDPKDIPRAQKFIEAKGIEKHLLIKKALENWNDGFKVTYAQIATTYRYDKRIRMVLFKYISYLEELYRGVLLDYAIANKEKVNWIKSIKPFLAKYGGDVNRTLERIEFSQLKTQCVALPMKIREAILLEKKKYLTTNLEAIVDLRNAVMHNKLLLLYRDWKICNVDGVTSATITSHIKNLLSFLPSEVAERCRREINACAVDRNEPSDAPWALVETIRISL